MSAITESARGEDCSLQIPGVCNGNSETVVWAHSNRLRHGKGVGKKSIDIFGAYACSNCHDVYDRRKKGIKHFLNHSTFNGQSLLATGFYEMQELEEYFQIGHDRSLIKLIENGIVVCK